MAKIADVDGGMFALQSNSTVVYCFSNTMTDYYHFFWHAALALDNVGISKRNVSPV